MYDTYNYLQKIRPEHLSRKAIVYLRQSSLRQVLKNTESQRLQYALKDRAYALGWNDVEVIDCDLGSSASMVAKPRLGFQQLISMVALGMVGIIFSREVSRFIRTDKDWCQLFDVCQIFDTLIGDAEQIYDLNIEGDQILFGLKGTLSVVELRTIKRRLVDGQENKAKRGELIRIMPVGYIKDLEGHVVLDPNKRVQDAIRLVLRKFRETLTIHQTFKWFHDHEIELPVNQRSNGSLKVGWQLPKLVYINYLLKNPFYAGAYAYGRRKTEVKYIDGRLAKKQVGKILPQEARVFIKEHHQGYITWEEYEETQMMIRKNVLNNENDETVAAVRKGHGLLMGLLRCGRCGRKLHVRYWGKSGTAARYLCEGDFPAGGHYCLGFGGAKVDRRFEAEVLQVISPLGIEASFAAEQECAKRGEDRRMALARQLQQLEYEAQRAFDQYNEADPKNRLVTDELERRWNEKLGEVDRCRKSFSTANNERISLSEDQRQRILHLGENFAEVWQSEDCQMELKKKIVRSIIEEIIINLDDSKSQLHFIIHWKGGCHTELSMPKPVSGAGKKTAMEDLDIIRKMAVRYGDDDIARVLNKLGRRTGKEKRWNQQRVATARTNHGITGKRHTRVDPEILSLGQTVKEYGVSDTTVVRLVEKGILKKEQIAPWAPWEIKRSDLESDPIQRIFEHLKQTGKLVFDPDKLTTQQLLFK